MTRLLLKNPTFETVPKPKGTRVSLSELELLGQIAGSSPQDILSDPDLGRYLERSEIMSIYWGEQSQMLSYLVLLAFRYIHRPIYSPQETVKHHFPSLDEEQNAFLAQELDKLIKKVRKGKDFGDMLWNMMETWVTRVKFYPEATEANYPFRGERYDAATLKAMWISKTLTAMREQLLRLHLQILSPALTRNMWKVNINNLQIPPLYNPDETIIALETLTLFNVLFSNREKTDSFNIQFALVPDMVIMDIATGNISVVDLKSGKPKEDLTIPEQAQALLYTWAANSLVVSSFDSDSVSLRPGETAYIASVKASSIWTLPPAGEFYYRYNQVNDRGTNWDYRRFTTSEEMLPAIMHWLYHTTKARHEGKEALSALLKMLSQRNYFRGIWSRYPVATQPRLFTLEC